MSRRIIINASQAEEVWVGIVDFDVLEDLHIESERRELLRGNIYHSVVVNLNTALNAAFVNYGNERNGFVSLKDIHPNAYHQPFHGQGEPNVENVIKVGFPLLVQVKKEEDGLKGAALTTEITLSNAYTLISPVSGGASIFSKKIDDAQHLRTLKSISKKIDPHQQYGITFRTASAGRTDEEIESDFQLGVSRWHQIVQKASQMTQPGLIVKEPRLSIRMVRDFFTDQVSEIVVDDRLLYDELVQFCSENLIGALPKLKLYQDNIPVFVKYGIEAQVNQLADHQIPLPSGGNLRINHTEALTVFDINSAGAKAKTDPNDQQQMFFETNCEAAVAIARQLRLRGIGGLVVIDFINMLDEKHKKHVEKIFRDAMRKDKAYHEISSLSKFCLLELSRKRVQEQSLSATHANCPTCDGSGYVPAPSIVSFKFLNQLYAHATQVPTGSKISAKLPMQHALFILNERKSVLLEIERKYLVQIEIIPDPNLNLLAENPFASNDEQIITATPPTATIRREVHKLKPINHQNHHAHFSGDHTPHLKHAKVAIAQKPNQAPVLKRVLLKVSPKAKVEMLQPVVAVQPVAVQPVAVQPVEVPKPVAVQPVAVQPVEVPKPVAVQPVEVPKPVAVQPVEVPKPVAVQPVAVQPVAVPVEAPKVLTPKKRIGFLSPEFLGKIEFAVEAKVEEIKKQEIKQTPTIKLQRVILKNQSTPATQKNTQSTPPADLLSLLTSITDQTDLKWQEAPQNFDGGSSDQQQEEKNSTKVSEILAKRNQRKKAAQLSD